MTWTALLILAAAVAVFYLVCWFVDLVDRIRAVERLAATVGSLHEKLVRLECQLTALQDTAHSGRLSGVDATHSSATEV
jgi:hypothetical protein